MLPLSAEMLDDLTAQEGLHPALPVRQLGRGVGHCTGSAVLPLLIASYKTGLAFTDYGELI